MWGKSSNGRRSQAANSPRLAYQVTGNGPPLVLLHGMSGSARWWRKNIPYLAQHNRVYAVDMTGFGGSRGQRFTLAEASGVLLRWMNGLGHDRFSVAGHSMGGFVAADLASICPEQVERLVLVDALMLPVTRSVARSAWGLVEALPRLPLDFLPVLAVDSLRAGPVNLLRAVHDIYRPKMTVDLTRIKAQTLIVWGEFDTLMPVSLGQRLHQALPQAAFHVIGGAGHNPMWDRPEAFNRVMGDFLSAGFRAR